MIIFRYLAREVIISMAAVSGVLLLIIMSGRFVKYLSQAAAGRLAADVLMYIMLYRMPGFLELILPLGLFIGFLLAYGRLYMESEMVVLSACGMSPKRLLAYSMFPAMLVAALVALLSLVISPYGVAQAEAIFKSQKQRSEFEQLQPARFQSSGSGGSVTYIDKITDDHTKLDNVFIAQMDNTGSKEAVDLAVMHAKSGTQVVDEETGRRYLQLNDGYRYRGTPGDADYQIVSFNRYRQLMEDAQPISRSTKSDSLSTRALLKSDQPENIAALHWRLSLPVLVVVVTLLAVPLSKTNPRQGRYIQMIPAILLYIIYLVSLNAARGAVEDDGVSPWQSIWAVHGVALILVTLLWLWPSVSSALKARKVAANGGAQHA